MDKFISELKKISVEDLIYKFSEISIEMFNNKHSCMKKIPVYVTRYGIPQEKELLLTSWDIPNIEYLSIIYSSDYRKSMDVLSMQNLINAYRRFDNEHSIASEIANTDMAGIFRIFIGMTAEQFRHQNLKWIFERFNRNYYMLVEAKHLEHQKDIDVFSAVKNTFGYSMDDYIAMLLMVYWLCSKHPDPLTAPEHIYRKKDSTIFTKDNITRFVEYYSCTYEDLRNSPLGKQLLYSKPFIKTNQGNEYLASCIQLIMMLVADGLYWIVRDYYPKRYPKENQKFPNVFGLLFEDYIKDLAATYCDPAKYICLPQGKRKGADYLFDFDTMKMIVESKSSMIRLDAKQQVPNMQSIDNFLKRAIKEAYEQLNKSYYKLRDSTDLPIMKVVLLYDEFSNTAIIEKSIPEIFEVDSCVFVMTIRQFEILLYYHQHDKEKFQLLINKFIASMNSKVPVSNIDAIYDDMEIYDNPHIDKMRYFEKAMNHMKNNLS